MNNWSSAQSATLKLSLVVKLFSAQLNKKPLYKVFHYTLPGIQLRLVQHIVHTEHSAQTADWGFCCTERFFWQLLKVWSKVKEPTVNVADTHKVQEFTLVSMTVSARHSPNQIAIVPNRLA